MKWRLLIVALYLMWGSSVLAQTATPTATVPTATPTNTPTITNTPTPTLNPQGAIIMQDVCPTLTPACEVRPGIKANHDGFKTVALVTTAGTGTSSLNCVVTTSYLAPTVKLGTMTGTACPTPGACHLGFWESCDELFVSHPGGTTVSAWLKMVSH